VGLRPELCSHNSKTVIIWNLGIKKIKRYCWVRGEKKKNCVVVVSSTFLVVLDLISTTCGVILVFVPSFLSILIYFPNFVTPQKDFSG
jgi:hypothetical protein